MRNRVDLCYRQWTRLWPWQRPKKGFYLAKENEFDQAIVQLVLKSPFLSQKRSSHLSQFSWNLGNAIGSVKSSSSWRDSPTISHAQKPHACRASCLPVSRLIADENTVRRLNSRNLDSLL